MPSIKITRTYTLPSTRTSEGRGRVRTEPLTYDTDDWRTPVEWAAEELANAGCTRHNWGPRFMAEEPKITDYSRGEEMEAMAELHGFTDDETAQIIAALGN